MPKLNKIKNGEYIGGDKYMITPDAGGKSRIVFSPDNTLTEPTPVGAEILNEMQLNAVYFLNTNRIIDGQKEIYSCNLEGYKDFENTDIILALKIKYTNTSDNVFIRLNEIDYKIKECGIGFVESGSIVLCRKMGAEIIIFDFYLKKEINKKVDKNGDIMTGPLDAPILTAETYFRLKDYYTHTLIAEFWFNKDNPNYFPETLYIDGIKDILVGRNRVYHQGFKPTAQDIGALPKEYCPYRVGDVLKTTSDIHPAISWVGTSWEKIENRFLMGTSGSEGAGGIGGASEIRLSVAHMPSHGHNLSITLQANGRHRHRVDDHIHGQPQHYHTLTAPVYGSGWYGQGGNLGGMGSITTSSAGGENTGVASPYTSFEPDHTHSVSASITETGTGQSFSIVPPYYKVHIWERLS